VGAKRILVCDDDQLELAAVRQTATEAGFEVIDYARHAVELLRLAELHQPDAVLVRNEGPGLSGIEATADLTELEHRCEVVLLTSDPSLEPHGLAAGAFAVVPRGDLDALEATLASLAEWLGGERRKGADRRSGVDRRKAQDWSKVFSERRSGEDRRKGPRRDADRS
jgi:DNA-binding NarL/FixJ family response regulator